MHGVRIFIYLQTMLGGILRYLCWHLSTFSSLWANLSRESNYNLNVSHCFMIWGVEQRILAMEVEDGRVSSPLVWRTFPVAYIIYNAHFEPRISWTVFGRALTKYTPLVFFCFPFPFLIDRSFLLQICQYSEANISQLSWELLVKVTLHLIGFCMDLMQMAVSFDSFYISWEIPHATTLHVMYFVRGWQEWERPQNKTTVFWRKIHSFLFARF